MKSKSSLQPLTTERPSKTKAAKEPVRRFRIPTKPPTRSNDTPITVNTSGIEQQDPADVSRDNDLDDSLVRENVRRGTNGKRKRLSPIESRKKDDDKDNEDNNTDSDSDISQLIVNHDGE